MNVTLCSAFRNASGYIPRYFKQVNALSRKLRRRGDEMLLNLAFGDSTDKTGAMLDRVCDKRHDTNLSEINHCGPEFGSVVNAERFKQLAYLWNIIWEQLPDIDSSPGGVDAIVYIESDLIWEPSVLVSLVDRLADYPAVSPMVMLNREGFPPDHFYDVWAARKDGRHISTRPPYFDGWDMQQPIQVDSMGSVMAIRGDLARQLCWPAEDVFVGLCRRIYELGGAVYLDPAIKVVHL